MRTRPRPYPPGISVVIPTEGRTELTAGLLRDLRAARESFALPSEVLVVDSSHDAEREVILRAAAETGARYLSGPLGVRRKRNLGVSEARYSVILFLDSDCRPAPDLLTRHSRSYETGSGPSPGGVLGRTLFDGPQTPAWHLVQSSSLVAHFSRASRSPSAPWGPTANISFRREVLDEVGLFDTGFPFKLGGDDLDLSYRVVKAGYRLACDPEAVVYHTRSTWSTLGSVLRRALRWGRMEYYLYRKHPSARFPAPPNFWGWALSVWALFGLQGVLAQTLDFAAWGLLWIPLALILYSAFEAADGTAGTRLRGFWTSLGAAVPELTYQSGASFEFARHGDPRFLWSRAWFDPDAPRTNWPSEARNYWSNLISLLVVQLLAFATYGRG